MIKESFMKKLLIMLLALLVSMLMFTGCGGDDKSGKAKSGADKKVKMAEGAERFGLEALPAWSKGFFVVNIKNAANSPFIDLFSGQIKKAEKKLKEVDIDLYKDVNELYMSFSNFKEFRSNPPKNVVILVTMNYDAKKLIAKFKEKAKLDVEEKIAGYTVLSSSKEKEKDFKLAFISGKALLATSANRIKEAIDLVKGKGKNILENKKLSPVIKTIQNNNFLWGAMEVSDELKNEGYLKTNPVASKIMKGLNIFKVASSIEGSTINLSLSAICQDDKSAKEIKKTAEQYLTMFKGAAPDIAKKIEIAQKDKTADINLSISKEEIDKLKKGKK